MADTPAEDCAAEYTHAEDCPETARRALVVGEGSPAEPVANGLTAHGWSVVRVAAFVQGTVDDLGPGRLDLVVHASYPASARQPALLVELTPDQWHEAADQPLRSAIDLARECGPLLAESGGVMVFLIPLVATAGGSHFTALATVGEGCRILAKSLARSWPDGVRTHAITLDPSAFLTPENAAGSTADNALHDRPLGRIPDLESDVAAVINSLAGPQLESLTGASLVVDGGLWMPG